MKKIILMLLLFMLIGCSDNKNVEGATEKSETEDEMIKLEVQIDDLKELLEENGNKINDLETMISKQKTLIDGYMDTADNMEFLNAKYFDLDFTIKNLDISKDLLYSYLESTESYEVIYCYLDSYDETRNQIEVDVVEWISSQDQDRVDELKIRDDMPNGYFIYNDKKVGEVFDTDEFFTCYENELAPRILDKISFFSKMNEKGSLCKIILIDGIVYQIFEKYLP